MVDKTKRLLKAMKKSTPVVVPIATDMVLPNHSGINSHPESKKNFVPYTGANANVNIGGFDFTTTGQINLGSVGANIITATNANGDLRLGAGGGTNDFQIDTDGNIHIFENLTTTGLGSFGNLDVDTNSGKLKLGDNQEFEIYHDGSDSYIFNKITGGILNLITEDAPDNTAANDINLITGDGGNWAMGASGQGGDFNGTLGTAGDDVDSIGKRGGSWDFQAGGGSNIGAGNPTGAKIEVLGGLTNAGGDAVITVGIGTGRGNGILDIIGNTEITGSLDVGSLKFATNVISDSTGIVVFADNLTINAGQGLSVDNVTSVSAAGTTFFDDIKLSSTKKVSFRDAAISINSATDGHLDLNADVSIGLNQDTIASGTIENPKAKITLIGGYAIRLTNKTGSNSIAGQLVNVYTATAIDDAFKTISANDENIIGIVLDTGVADGSEVWVVVNGIADVLMDAGGSARGDRIISSATAGSADVWNVGGAVATHFQEIGHCIETRTGAGLARCVLHFN